MEHTTPSAIQHEVIQASSLPNGIEHGPFAPPELDSDPKSAAWLMSEAGSDLALYVALRQRAALYDAVGAHLISPEAMEYHAENIGRAVVLPLIAQTRRRIREVRPDHPSLQAK